MPKIFAVQEFDPEKFVRDILSPGHPNNTLENIVRFLSSCTPACKTVIEEQNYVDLDYLDEYSAFYSKAFKGYPSRCTRYHFFSKKISQTQLTNISDFKTDYLGFMVLRPTEHPSVGRTMLKREPRVSENEYINCLAYYKAHILGQQLKVTSTPFTQQDAQVGACAQAALWMVARYMSARFGDREFTPPQINALAKKNNTRGRPYPADRGLDPFQMLDALHGMGYAAEIHTAQTIVDMVPHIAELYKNLSKKTRKHVSQRTLKLADISYRYIESGLPVVFLTEDHAFVGIGHTIHQQKQFRHTIERIPSFVSNNDDVGPYQEVPIWKARRGKVSFKDIIEIITIMPQDASLRGEEAEATALGLIQEIVDRELKSLLEVLKDRPELAVWWQQNLLLRTYLIKSVEWQRDLLQQKREKIINTKVCDLLLELDYPKHIWITEITTSALLNDKSTEKKCLGFFILDSTAPAKTMSALAAHIFDTLIIITSTRDPYGRATTESVSRHFRNSTPVPVKQVARIESP